MIKSYVYILFFEGIDGFLKIGKADCLESRITCLERHYGKCHLEKSLSLEVPASVVNRLEKSLHMYVDDSKAKKGLIEKSDGYTEFFNTDCLDDLLEYVSFLSKKMKIKVVQGISYKEKTCNYSKENPWPYIHLIRSLISESGKVSFQLSMKQASITISDAPSINFSQIFKESGYISCKQIGKDYVISVDNKIGNVSELIWAIINIESIDIQIDDCLAIGDNSNRFRLIEERKPYALINNQAV